MSQQTAFAQSRATTEQRDVPLRLTLLFLASLTVMSGATIAPSLPALQAHFADSAHSELQTRLVLTLPALFIALGAPVAGYISDRFGRRPLLLASILLYALAGTSALLQDSLPGILAGRALLGIAVAGTMTSVTALAGDYFSGAAREEFMTQQTAFISFGGVLFLIGGGLLADWHWRAPFSVYTVALVLLPAAFFYLHEPHKPAVVGTTVSQQLQRYTKLALAGVFAAAMINSLAFYLIPTQLPFLLQEIGTTRPSSAGIAIAGGNLLGAISSLLLYRRIRAGLGVFGVFAFCFSVMGAGLGLVAAASSYAAVVASIALFGIGMGAMMPHLANTAIGLAPPAMRGRVSGGLTASIFTGQFLSPLLSQPLVHAFGYSDSFALTGVLLLLLAIFALYAALWRRAVKAIAILNQAGSIMDWK